MLLVWGFGGALLQCMFFQYVMMSCRWAISRHCLKPLSVEGDSLFVSNSYRSVENQLDKQLGD